MADRWIVIPRWDEFQHADAARSRTLPWIKSWTRLLSDDAYLHLSGHQRAVLHGIWLEYARSHCQLSLDPLSLSRRLALRVTTQQLEALNHAGFIHFSASKPASTSASKVARPEESREETPKSPSGNARNGTAHICGIDGCTVTYTTATRIAEHRENVHDVVPDQEPALELATVPADGYTDADIEALGVDLDRPADPPEPEGAQ